jgi:exonuclease 3'-5' domain-containing protein 1
MSEPEVVCKNKRCREIVRELKKSDVISVDAEGVNLGKEGPLTLLQIGTIDGQVYLFDVHMNPDIFRRGKLIEILQSDKILKVSLSNTMKLVLNRTLSIELRHVYNNLSSVLVLLLLSVCGL